MKCNSHLYLMEKQCFQLIVMNVIFKKEKKDVLKTRSKWTDK